MPKYEHVFICRQDLTSVQAETLAEEFKGTLDRKWWESG